MSLIAKYENQPTYNARAKELCLSILNTYKLANKSYTDCIDCFTALQDVMYECMLDTAYIDKDYTKLDIMEGYYNEYTTCIRLLRQAIKETR